MAEQKPLKAGQTGAEQMTGTDTLPVANIPDLTSAKISDFNEAAQDAVGGSLTDSSTNSEKTATPRRSKPRVFPLPFVLIMVLQREKTASVISLPGRRIKN